MNGFLCTQCRREFPVDSVIWRCSCGGLLDLVWDTPFDPALLPNRPGGLWRYREALPVPEGRHISLGEPLTPLVPVTLWEQTVHVKMDHLLPTGSFKDRGAAVLMSWVHARGIPEVVEDSSGNAGAAISAYAAAAGIRCHIYVPAATSPSKVRQIELAGTTIHRIDGPRENAGKAAQAHAEKVYYASHSWNPLFLHGTKTVAFEIAETLGWRSPDYLVVPVGNGTLLLGAWLGFRQLKAWGHISHLPRLVAVQAAGATTIAEGIAVANPVRGTQIRSAVQESGGSFVVVDNAQIHDAHSAMAAQGLWMEPTSAAGFAGLKQALDGIPKDAVVVSVVTGHGWKGGM